MTLLLNPAKNGGYHVLPLLDSWGFMKKLALSVILWLASLNVFASDDMFQRDQAYVTSNGLSKSVVVSQDDLNDGVAWLMPLLSKDAAYDLTTKPPSHAMKALIVIGGVARLYRLKSKNPVVLDAGFFTEYSCVNSAECTKKIFFDHGYKMTREYSDGKLNKEVHEYRIGKRVTLYKYPASNQREECSYYFASSDFLLFKECTPYLNNKKHGKERRYDRENRLNSERLYKNGDFVHQISKRDWYTESGGGVKYYFDSISKIEDGLCVTRKVSDNSELSVNAANDYSCLGPTTEELLLMLP